MTAVLFKFSLPDGTPVANAPFLVTTRKPSFDETLRNGIQVQGDVQGLTDDKGEATLTLLAGFATYYLLMDAPGAGSDSDGCNAGLRYRFLVPESTEILRVEDLIVTTPTFSRPWDETALQIIIDAKASSQHSADSAKASEVAAGEFATQAEASIEATRVNAEAAAASALAASLSKTASGENAAAALTARNQAEGFRDQSRVSELAAAGSATAAGGSAAAAAARVAEASEFADQSKLSADASELSRVGAVAAANTAAGHVTTTQTNVNTTEVNKQATAADLNAVTVLKGDVSDLHDETKVYRDEALAAVGTITGALVDGGLVNLSSGAYPAKPMSSTIWRVTVGGTVTTVKEGTITYGIGDQLVYTKPQDTWYKIDNQSAVSSVNNMTGAVEITPTTIGLGKVNNTTDLEKPVSNAVRAELDSRTPTASRQDTTANRLTKVGDYGLLGTGAIVMTSAQNANSITVSGLYVFNGGGLNLPFSTVYIRHYNHAVVNYAKQVAYGLLDDRMWLRTQNNGVWSNWSPSVDIVDNLNSSDPAKALSARQGKELLALIQANNATVVRYTYNLAAGQTSIGGPDLSGLSLAYVPGVPFLIEKDGFPIWLGNDYTASNGTTVTMVASSPVASEIAITVFGSFAVADHYNKAQTDLLLQNMSAQVSALQNKIAASEAQMNGHISGFKLVYVGRQEFMVTAGSAYVPSLSKIVTTAADLTYGNLTGLLPASGFTHLYLYADASGVGQIELSTTAPVRYYGTAYQKAGDASRRYLGSVLSSSTRALWAFRHDPAIGKIVYTEGSPGTQPFSVWGASPMSATSPTLVTTVVANSGAGAIAPKDTTTALHGVASMQGSGTVFVSPADQNAAIGASTWGNSFGSTGTGIGMLDIYPARSGANVGGFYIWVSAASVQNYINGYTFER